MPLVLISGGLVHFAHVPRCGGSAVEAYLRARFGPLAFLDGGHRKVPLAEHWSKTSPQHIETAALERMIPSSWIVHRFAVVRHPEDRIKSVFCFQRDIKQTIPVEIGFAEWVATLQAQRDADPHYLDNHTRPACDLVPNDAIVFKLEDGLERVVAWLDLVEGEIRKPREICRVNDYSRRMARLGRKPGKLDEIRQDTKNKISDFYQEDFQRFLYEKIGLFVKGLIV